MAETNQSRTTKKWRAKGYYVEVTEQIRGFIGPGVPRRVRTTRKDLHGFADCVALNGREYVFLQPTSWDNVPARLRKIQRESIGKGKQRIRMRAIARMILALPCHRIVIEGWRQDKRTLRWECREREVTLADLEVSLEELE